MITVTITRDELEQRKACGAGLQLFEAISRMQGSRDGTVLQVLDWTPLHSLWLLRDGRAACDAVAGDGEEIHWWLVGEGLIPAPNLAGASLAGADLTGAYRPIYPPAGWDTDSYGYLVSA